MGNCFSRIRHRQNQENTSPRSGQDPAPGPSSALGQAHVGLYQATGDLLNDILGNCQMTNGERKNALQWIQKKYPETFTARFGELKIAVILHNNDTKAENETAAQAPPRFCTSLQAEATAHNFMLSLNELVGNKSIPFEEKRHMFQLYKECNNPQYTELLKLLVETPSTSDEEPGKAKPGGGEEVNKPEGSIVIDPSANGGEGARGGGGETEAASGEGASKNVSVVKAVKGQRMTIG